LYLSTFNLYSHKVTSLAEPFLEGKAEAVSAKHLLASETHATANNRESDWAPSNLGTKFESKAVVANVSVKQG
jgi:hypothetical protein